MKLLSQFIFVIFVAIGFTSTAQGYNDLRQNAPFIEQIITNEQGVCMLIGDSWLISEGLQATGDGIFVLINGEWKLLSEVSEQEARLKSWKCKKCGRYNLEGINACAYCGKPRYE
jgi:hypothetical protein